MRVDEIVAALSSLPDVQVTTSGSQVRGYVPAIDDSFRLLADEVRWAQPIFAPNGDPAVQLTLGDGRLTRHLIVLDDDVAFPPAGSEVQLDSPIPWRVNDAPHLVTYSEMLRDVELVALAYERRQLDNLAELAGNLLLQRCFIMGALVVGLYPVTAMAWWQRSRTAVGNDLPMPPFRADAAWDRLAQDAARITVAPRLDREPSEGEPAGRPATREDFERLGATMSVAQLDDEFLELWNRWIPLAPATMSATLTKGIPEATFEINLYPEGTGSVDLRLQPGGELRALFQLRFSFPDSAMDVDELWIAEAARGKGVFQRLLFNSEELGRQLGLAEVRVLATGIGRYALARVGVYPQ